jgi:hypothetical protein
MNGHAKTAIIAGLVSAGITVLLLRYVKPIRDFALAAPKVVTP